MEEPQVASYADSNNNNSQPKHEPFALGHSLTSVLNDPKIFPKEWSAEITVPPSDAVPNVQLSNFNNYIQTIQPVFQLFLSNKRGQQPQERRRSFVDISSDLKPYTQAISEVPDTFFREEFSISDQLSVASQTDTSSSALLLQEKLSHYLDNVEVELIRQISVRSSSFFAALSNLQELHEEVRRTVNQIEYLRRCLSTLDEEVVKKALGVTHLRKKRDNFLSVYKKLKLISTVKSTQQTIQLLLSTSDYLGALDLIYTTQRLLDNELAGVHSFRHMNLQLGEMINLIEKIMQADFLKLTAQISEAEISGNENSVTEKEECRDQLIPIVIGLLRLNKFQITLQAFKEQVIVTIKRIIKKTLESALATTTLDEKPTSPPEKPSSAVELKLQQLKGSQYLDLMSLIYKRILSQLEQVSSVHELLLSLITSTKRDNSRVSRLLANYDFSVTESYGSQVVSSSLDILYSICETSHSKCTRLLKMRTEVNSKLGIVEFVNLFEISQNFIKDSEKLCGKQCSVLRSSLLDQAKAFVDVIHTNRMNSLALTLENESWSQADIATEFQQIVDLMVTPGTSMLSLPPSLPDGALAKHLTIKSDKFFVVNSCLMLIKMLKEYLQCLEQLPLLSTDILQKIVEILKLFNSRTCQLVLGAGAMQLMQLKSITAKHLALASQCLSVQMELIPGIQEHIKVHLPPKKHILLNDLDRVIQDYMMHSQEISQKFVAILRERVQVHCRTLKALEWKDDSITIPTQAMSSLVKETTTLHKVLSQIFSPEMVSQIFGNVFFMVNTKVPEYFTNFTISTSNGKKRFLQDISYLLTSLGSLNAGDPGTGLEEYFEKQLGEKK